MQEASFVGSIRNHIRELLNLAVYVTIIVNDLKNAKILKSIIVMYMVKHA